MQSSIQSTIQPSIPPLFTRNFWLISLASLAFFTSVHLLTPAFPLFLQQVGQFQGGLASWQVGAILSSFIVASLLLRPLIGKWCDERGCRPYMIAGALLFIGMPLLYPWVQNPLLFFPIRILHGMGMALFYTASQAFLSQEVPTQRRAEGMSHYSNAIKLAMAFAPPLGLLLAGQHQFQSLFGLSAAGAVVALLCVLGVQETDTRPILSGSQTQGKLIQPRAFLPGGVMAANSIVFGTLIPFIPFFFLEKGFLHEASWFYTVYAVFLIFSRGLTGPVSDRYGRAQVVIPGMLGVSVALLLMAVSTNLWVFLLCTAFYGLCAGTVQPSLMALTVDRVQVHERGSAMATFTLLNDSGVALGTFLTGTLGPLIGYAHTLWIIAAITLLGLLYFVLQHRLEQRSEQTSMPTSRSPELKGEVRSC